MRLRIGILLVILLLYVTGSSIVSARAASVHHRWSGEGNAQVIHFSMPAGPLPGVSSRAWVLRYQLACHGLKSTPGAPIDTYMQPTFGFNLTGGMGGMMGGSNQGHSTTSVRFGDGGAFTLSITARSTCRWTVSATSA